MYVLSFPVHQTITGQVTSGFSYLVIMKLAITGCSGKVGRVVVREALKREHTVVGIDHVTPTIDWTKSNTFVFIQTDLANFDAVLNALKGCDGVIHLAAIPNPTDYKVASHNRSAAFEPHLHR